MPDYDLSGLSSRSFEQLIQSLAAKILGPGIIVFGDGPDGGREATFNGQVPFPSSNEPWNGYLVVQAKFRQRPKGDSRDAGWLLEQIQSELKKFEDMERGLRRPDFYIVATNVVLSSVADTGGKDKIYRLLERAKGRLGVKDCRIWDYDQIRVFLDAHQEIRSAYTAWITPGDVLASAMQALRPERSDFESVISIFLQKQLLADLYANLEQAGHASDERAALAHVFVDLPAFDHQLVDPPDEEPGRLKPGILSRLLEHGALKLDPRSALDIRKDERYGSTVEAGRFVLVGGPGQGKSTLGQFLAQLYRASLLRERPPYALLMETRRALDDIDRQCEQEGIAPPKGKRFPIRIVLNRFATAISSKSANRPTSLLMYVIQQIHRLTDSSVSPQDFRRWLAEYPWLLILDGLDEVPASSNRAEVLSAIQDFRVDAAECNADLLILATTRPQGYDDDFAPSTYKHLWLAPLSTPRALHYAKRLVGERHSTDVERQAKILDRLNRAANEDSTARLMRSPLQVTIMAALVDQMGQPPRERWRLFHDYYDVIYRREMERDIPAAVLLRDHRADIDAIHQQVGLLLQVESEHSGRTDARISSERLDHVITNRLIEQGHDGAILGALRRRIIEAASERLVFLVGVERDQAGFEIRSLQEFMAAEALMSGSDEALQSRLRKIAPVSSWRNVFLFAAGKCFSQREYLRDTIYTICAELNDPAAEPEAGYSFLGARLALDVLEEGIARNHPKYARIIAQQAMELLSTTIYVETRKLADVYEDSLEATFATRIGGACRDPNGKAYENAWSVLIQLVFRRVPWAMRMAGELWPSDLKSQERILLATRSQTRASSSWQLSKIVEILPRLDLHTQLVIGSSIFLSERMKAPQWLKMLSRRRSVAARSSPLVLNLRAADGSASVARFGYASLKALKDLNAPLSKLPNQGAGSAALLAISEFSQRPSSRLLAQVLTLIQRANAAGMMWLVEELCPWPVRSCLQLASTDASALSILVDAAARGDLGDADDWLTAEKRWEQRGISEDDILYTPDNGLPFDRNIGAIGVPGGEGRFSRSRAEIEHSRQILKLLKKAKNKASIRMLSTALSSILMERVSVEKEELAHILRAWPHDYFAIELVAQIQNIDEFVMEYPCVLHELGLKVHVYGRYSAADILKKADWKRLQDALVDAFRSNSTLTGLLVFLAVGAEFAQTKVPSEWCTVDKNDAPSVASARLVLRMASGEWRDGDIPRLVEQWMHSDGMMISPQSLPNLMSENGIRDELVVKLLIALSAISDKGNAHGASSALYDFVSRKSSGLTERQTWRRLSLPESLFNQLRLTAA